jgi:hypothetical protein
MDAMPKTRGGCLNEPRPCPHVTCRYHVGRTKARASTASCVLDEADRGGRSLQEIADVFGVSRERIRQLEARALRKLAESGGLTESDLATLLEVAR